MSAARSGDAGRRRVTRWSLGYASPPRRSAPPGRGASSFSRPGTTSSSLPRTGIFHMAEYSVLLGVKLKDVPPGIGTRREILAKYGLAAQGCSSIRISDQLSYHVAQV